MTRSIRTLLLAALLVSASALAGGVTSAATPVADPATPSDPCIALTQGTGEISGTVTTDDGHHMSGMDMGTPMTGMAAEPDLMFIDMMIPHHRGAIAMAQVALMRAEHPELKELARSIIASQTAEIEQMQAWRDAWYPDAPVAAMESMGSMEMDGSMMVGTDGSMDTMDDGAMLAAICAATGEFDLAFIDLMTPHHADAIVMATELLPSTVHEELKGFLQGIIDAQSAEVEQMAEWRAAWYPDAPPVEGDSHDHMGSHESGNETDSD